MDTGENKEKNGEKEKKGEKVGKKEKEKEEVKEKVDLKEAARDSEREQSCTGDEVRDRSVSEITRKSFRESFFSSRCRDLLLTAIWGEKMLVEGSLLSQNLFAKVLKI